MTPRTLDLPADADARRAIADALDDTFVVEAAAGTGKTTELVTRIVRVLATGRATMDEIVAVTFTEKAAGELKLRLREAVEVERAASADATVRLRLEDALRSLEEAHVSTIHGFCAELLRERPVEAGVDPLFVVLTEVQAERLFARAFHHWLEQALGDPPEGVRRALRRTNAPWFGGEDAAPIDRVRDAAWEVARLRDFTCPWSRTAFDRDVQMARIIVGLHRLAEMSAAGSPKDNLFQSLDGVRRLSRQILLEESLGRPDRDGWEARLCDLTRDPGLAKTKKGYGAKYGTRSRTEVLAARDAFYADLLRFRADADADLAALLHQELQPPVALYRAAKDRHGALDFVDLLARARDVLRTDAGVRTALRQRFKRIFVDEFQDTDPVQAEILLLLSAAADATDWTQVAPEPGKLFIVGDPKQAIYRFRGADVGTYWKVRNQLVANGGRVLELRTNFRSVPGIQRFVNRAFEAQMMPDEIALQAGYVSLAERRPAIEGQPNVVVLSVPAPYSTGRSFNSVTARAIEASLPDAIAAFIDWLLNASGWEVSERGTDGVERRSAVQPQHVAILFRRFTSYTEDVTRPYISAIEARGIPHLLVGGKTFHDREEVETIRAALAAIEWPDDELSVFATLKGSMFAVDDEQLLEYRDRFRVLHPYRIPRELGGNSGRELALVAEPTTHLMPIADALRTLQDLHRRRNYRPVADTISRLIAATRAHVAFVLRPGGEQALANVLHVAELARQYESSGGISFRGFIDELRRAAEDTDATEAPIVEEGGGGVRLMTVHKAKGLEFPVVILADPTCRLSRDDASRFLDAGRRLCAVRLAGWAPRELHEHETEEVLRDRAEGVRLTYVAATRARDVLVVPAVGDGPWEGGWLDPLNRAVYPAGGERQHAHRAPKCPALKSKDTVLVRPDDRQMDLATVAPGQHSFHDYSVVWWDPRWLTLGTKPPSGIRRQDLIAKDAPGEVVASGRFAYEKWRKARDVARHHGALPSLLAATARDVAARTDVAIPSIAVKVVETSDRVPCRARGIAFGLLAHAILADVPLDARREQLDAAAMAIARGLGLSEVDAREAVDVVERVLAHDVIRDARAARVCRRETPVTVCLADGTVVEGIVDLAYEHGGAWMIVDYKTDREIVAAGGEKYTRQVQLYASAIAQASGRPASAVVLRI